MYTGHNRRGAEERSQLFTRATDPNQSDGKTHLSRYAFENRFNERQTVGKATSKKSGNSLGIKRNLERKQKQVVFAICKVWEGMGARIKKSIPANGPKPPRIDTSVMEVSSSRGSTQSRNTRKDKIQMSTREKWLNAAINTKDRIVLCK